MCRSLFKDNKSAVIYHADVGAAANHIRVFYKGAKLAYLEKKLFKITKPIKIGKDATWSLPHRSRLIREKIFEALSGEFTLKIPPARSNLLFSLIFLCCSSGTHRRLTLLILGRSQDG